MHSIISIYKPTGPTSHDMVGRVRKITDIKKVGHGGTLDPLASGVLIIAIGREATKQLATIVAKEKEYTATILLGQSSTTDDSEGEKTTWKINSIPTRTTIENILKTFVGTIEQMPPQFSALKVSGQTAYKAARKGNKIELKARPVFIKSIELTSYKWPLLQIKVMTGPGAYIRSLARDIGEKLGVGGYVSELERTRVGEFTKEKSMTIEEFEKSFRDKV